MPVLAIIMKTMTMNTIHRKTRSYEELIRLPTFEERYEYLKLSGRVGESTFGYERMLNQSFYASQEWKKFRRSVIIRDNGCDLGIEGYEIFDRIIVHHINPITPDDIEMNSSALMNMNNVICVSFGTHEAIHFGDSSLLPKAPIQRYSNDMSPWLG